MRISDLGLACDFSRKRPHASVGTHGYMAPEVLQRGLSYDSSADWFSFGCMLYKLLRGHSPFRHHKIRDKHEIDRMTMTMVRFSVNLLAFCREYCCIFHRFRDFAHLFKITNVPGSVADIRNAFHNFKLLRFCLI